MIVTKKWIGDVFLVIGVCKYHSINDLIFDKFFSIFDLKMDTLKFHHFFSRFDFFFPYSKIGENRVKRDGNEKAETRGRKFENFYHKIFFVIRI